MVLQKSIHDGMQIEDRHFYVEVITELAVFNPIFDELAQKFRVRLSDFAQKLFPEWKILIEKHLEVDTVNVRVSVCERPACEETFFDALEEVAFRSISDFLERLLELGNGVTEEVFKQPLFVAEVFEERTLGNAETANNAVYARLMVSVVGKFPGGLGKNPLPLFVRKVFKSFG